MAIQIKVQLCPFKLDGGTCELDSDRRITCYRNGTWRSCETYLFEITKLDDEAREKKRRDELIKIGLNMVDFWKNQNGGNE